MIRKSVIITILLVFGLTSPVLAQSIGVGAKVNAELAAGVFFEWYLSPNLSLGLSLGVQSAAVSVETVGRFYSPDYMGTLTFYGGGGGRLRIAGGSRQPFALLLLGVKMGLALNFNLLGELELVSALDDLRRFDLETWLGMEARLGF